MKQLKPHHISLFIWSCMGVLAILCLILPTFTSQTGIKWPTLGEVLTTAEYASTEYAYPTVGDECDIPYTDSLALDSLLLAFGSEISSEMGGGQETDASIGVISHTNFTVSQAEPLETCDYSSYLRPFFHALENASNQQVRVVHFGDSQIEEDRMSVNLRNHLQSIYGGGGVGLIPLHQTIISQSLKQTLTIHERIITGKQGIKRFLVYGPKVMRRKNDRYGVMGQVCVMDNQLFPNSEQAKLYVESRKKDGQNKYFDRIRLWSDGNILMQLDGQNTTSSEIIHLPSESLSATILLKGKGDVYGLSLETQNGVFVDNIPMRGCQGNIFTNISDSMLTDYFTQTNTKLIIMQFGGNSIPSAQTEAFVRGIVSVLRQQVRYMRHCAPDACILFIGPSDMLTTINGNLDTYPMVPVLDAHLQKMAQEEGIAYWSLYHAMGGYHSMMRWQQCGLAGNDGIHFTRKGADKAGEMLWQWLEDQKNGIVKEEIQDSIHVKDTLQSIAKDTSIVTDTLISNVEPNNCQHSDSTTDETTSDSIPILQTTDTTIVK